MKASPPYNPQHLALTPGSRLGVFLLADLLGRGGMGEVYRARDTKLDRDVAIKILPDAFAHDTERLARFTREAKTLASLNHPNIAAIYGLEEGEVNDSGTRDGCQMGVRHPSDTHLTPAHRTITALVYGTRRGRGPVATDRRL